MKSLSAKANDEVKQMKIAVEQNLGPVIDYLTNQGYTVDKFDAGELLTKKQDYDALVISGGSENFLGMEDRTAKGSVINADGCTPEEVYQKIDNLFTRAGR
jgi:hypothetical protein